MIVWKFHPRRPPHLPWQEGERARLGEGEFRSISATALTLKLGAFEGWEWGEVKGIAFLKDDLIHWPQCARRSGLQMGKGRETKHCSGWRGNVMAGY